MYNVMNIGPRPAMSFIRSTLPSLFVRQMTERNLIIPKMNISILGCIGQGISMKSIYVRVNKQLQIPSILIPRLFPPLREILE